MTGDKFRFRFRKSGTLRLVSHHDLMRCAERMLRRAAVPFKSTAGFHPTPRLVFALSLPLGVVGCDEVVELELTEPRDGDDLLATLNAQAPAGLTFTRVSAVPMKATARVRRAVYTLPVPPDRAPQIAAAAAALLGEPAVWVERLRPNPKRLNLRPYVRGVSVADGALRLDLWVTQDGTARAEELLARLAAADLLAGGAVLERTAIEIRDEVAATDPPGSGATESPPDGPSDSVPLTGAEVAALTARLDAEANEQPADASWGQSPNGPVVE
jgi:radical SAM-linked protein